MLGLLFSVAMLVHCIAGPVAALPVLCRSENLRSVVTFQVFMTVLGVVGVLHAGCCILQSGIL
jgi:hypothetical protein